MEKVTTEICHADQNETLRVSINGKDFFLPFKMISGRKVAFLDISGQVSLIESCADLLAQRIMENGLSFDTILNPVSKSNALAHATAVRLSQKSGKNLSRTIVARKAKPGEHHRAEACYRSVTTDSEQIMYLTDDDITFISGKRILLMDDVFGKGGTTNGLTALCKKTGAVITGQAVIAVEKGTDLPDGLIYLFSLPVLTE